MSLPPSSTSDSAGAEAERVARVVVVGRAGCHLCANAEEIVAQVCRDLAETYAVVDLDEVDDLDPDSLPLPARELARVDPDELPVTFVDGRRHDFWRVDAERLRGALRDL